MSWKPVTRNYFGPEISATGTLCFLQKCKKIKVVLQLFYASWHVPIRLFS